MWYKDLFGILLCVEREREIASKLKEENLKLKQRDFQTYEEILFLRKSLRDFQCKVSILTFSHTKFSHHILPANNVSLHTDLIYTYSAMYYRCL